MDLFLSFWAGLVLGSFVNVLVYRIPKDQSVVFPGSRCPRCEKPIAFYDNIPVVSWLLLRGRCRRCKAAISPRYPLIELSMGLVSLAIWNRWSVFPAWGALAMLAAAILLAIAMIDWDTFLIPDELSLGLLALGLACSPVNPFFSSPSWYFSLLKSFGGGVVGLLICWGTAAVGEKIFKKEAMGGGDIKLLAAVGAWTGGLGAFDCLIVASFLGSVYGVALMMRGKLGRSEPMPFGPFLSAAAVFNFFYLLPLGFPFV